MLIINADDFGLDHDINRAIIQCFKKGLCSSTTIMPNMPGFEEACQLVHENRLTNHIGMHLVLRDGNPLTEKIKRFSAFCDKDGQLCFSRDSHTFRLKTSEKEVLAGEIKAQIKRCRNYGIPITHIDSHYHAHTEWAIATLLIPLARTEGIPYVRISRNCGPALTFTKKVYKYALNYKLRIAGLARTKYFGSVEDYVFSKRQIGVTVALKSFEVMIHPRFNAKQLLVDYTNDKALEETIQVIDSYKTAVSFKGIKYQ